jgi:hypothetical protein
MYLLVSVVYTRVIDIKYFDFIVCSIIALGTNEPHQRGQWTQTRFKDSYNKWRTLKCLQGYIVLKARSIPAL